MATAQALREPRVIVKLQLASVWGSGENGAITDSEDPAVAPGNAASGQGLVDAADRPLRPASDSAGSDRNVVQ